MNSETGFIVSKKGAGSNRLQADFGIRAEKYGGAGCSEPSSIALFRSHSSSRSERSRGRGRARGRVRFRNENDLRISEVRDSRGGTERDHQISPNRLIPTNRLTSGKQHLRPSNR